MTVAFLLVPEAIAFALIAGVDLLVCLYAALVVGLITLGDWRSTRNDIGRDQSNHGGDGQFGGPAWHPVFVHHRGPHGDHTNPGWGSVPGEVCELYFPSCDAWVCQRLAIIIFLPSSTSLKLQEQMGS